MITRKIIYNNIIILLVISLTACGASRQIRPEVKAKINNIEARVIFKNPDIYAYASSSNGLLPGTLGLVVNVAMSVSDYENDQRKADAIWPLVKELRSYNIPLKTTDNYKEDFDKIKWMKVKKWEVEKGGVPSVFETTKNSKYDAVLFIEVSYYLSSSLKRLSVNSKARLYRNMGKKWDPQQVFEMTDGTNYDLSKQLAGIYDNHEIGKKLSSNKAEDIKEKILKAFKEQSINLVKNLDPPKNLKEKSFSERFWGGKVKTQ